MDLYKKHTYEICHVIKSNCVFIRSYFATTRLTFASLTKLNSLPFRYCITTGVYAIIEFQLCVSRTCDTIFCDVVRRAGYKLSYNNNMFYILHMASTSYYLLFISEHLKYWQIQQFVFLIIKMNLTVVSQILALSLVIHCIGYITFITGISI